MTPSCPGQQKEKVITFFMLLDPTDSCRDRLAAFLFWNDFAGLEQALSVYRAQSDFIDLSKVKAWCHKERQQEKYELFLERLNGIKV